MKKSLLKWVTNMRQGNTGIFYNRNLFPKCFQTDEDRYRQVFCCVKQKHIDKLFKLQVFSFPPKIFLFWL